MSNELPCICGVLLRADCPKHGAEVKATLAAAGLEDLGFDMSQKEPVPPKKK